MGEAQKLDQIIKKKYGKPCGHFHVSGRRCGQRIARKYVHCETHKGTGCTECDSMKQAFQPRNGWRT